MRVEDMFLNPLFETCSIYFTSLIYVSEYLPFLKGERTENIKRSKIIVVLELLEQILNHHSFILFLFFQCMYSVSLAQANAAKFRTHFAR